MIIDCISDLHGHYPELEGGDLLIVAGDLTARDDFQGWLDFVAWLQLSRYKKKIVIGGNHDGWFVKNPPNENTFGDECYYLCDSSTEFEGLKIWGSPWTKTFSGMNPKCKAFTYDTEAELEEKWNLIPNDTDILVTHSPPYLGMDTIYDFRNQKCMNVGSKSLFDKILNVKPLLHVFGHIHENGGQKENNRQCRHDRGDFSDKGTISVNASHVNEYYKPVNKPIRVEL